jgi:hypothetical protein
MNNQLVSDKICCVCGKQASGCYGRFIRSKMLFFAVCADHLLSSQQKVALLNLSFRSKTDDEILNSILNVIRFYHERDAMYEKAACS